VGADEGSETFETFRELLRVMLDIGWQRFRGDESELTSDGCSLIQGIARAAAQSKSYGARGRWRPGEGSGGARFQTVPSRGDIECVGRVGAAALGSWSSEAEDSERGKNDGGEEAHSGGVCCRDSNFQRAKV
jgi:hypothetical protein